MIRRASALFLLPALLCGCPEEAPAPPPPPSADAQPASGGIPAETFVGEKPAGAEPLLAVKGKAKAGDAVLFEARIGGRKAPFVDGRALFTVADSALVPCSENEGDGCQTPWDYCCETPKTLLEQTATVRLVDGGGQPLEVGLEGEHGLAGLKTVVVEGKVSERNDAGVFVVDATKVWVSN